VLQFGGASGSGYLLPREVKAGMEEMKKFGEFKDGIFHRHDGIAGNVLPSKRNMDAYQAIWENLHKREMVYPKGRYGAPIFMDSANFSWAPVKSARGVSEKLLGVWTERRAKAGLIKLEADARYEAKGRGIYLVLSGRGACEAKNLLRYTSIFLDRGETAQLHAQETTELLHYGLPDLSDLQASADATATAQAAE